MAKPKNNNQVDEALSEVQKSFKNSPKEVVKAQSKKEKRSAPKSAYENHPKFDKFKKEGK